MKNKRTRKMEKTVQIGGRLYRQINYKMGDIRTTEYREVEVEEPWSVWDAIRFVLWGRFGGTPGPANA